MKPYLHIDFIQIKTGNILIIEGHTLNTNQAYLNVSGKMYELSFQHDNIFKTTVDISRYKKCRISAYSNDKTIAIRAGVFSGLTDFFKSYTVKNGHIVTLSNSVLRISAKKSKNILYLEFFYVLQIIFNWKIKYTYYRFLRSKTSKEKLIRIFKSPIVIIESIITMPRDIMLRVYYWYAKNNKKKQVWIISDRGMAAGDNGEALFKYIKHLKNSKIDVYFAISKRSRDFNRLAGVGLVLDYGSLKYKLKFLLADKIISSQADIEVTNPFTRHSNRFSNIFKFDFIFLQHGIIRNDLSGWLNRFEKNIDIFVTSAEKEYSSILKYPYGYTKNNVLLSGLPRYDYLKTNSQNKIIFMPTYRANILRHKTNRYGARKYDIKFKNSLYFNFYSSLINDPTVLDAMKKNNMKGELYIHPNFAAQLADFKGNELVKVMDYPYDYNKAIAEGSVMVSDYSSLVFDFAYLKKPVLYTQFDKDEFFNKHTYSQGNFFDDEKDGFGEVFYNYKDSVDGIVRSIENNCNMEQKYKNRVDLFFKYRDKNNSKRVFIEVNKSKK